MNQHAIDEMDLKKAVLSEMKFRSEIESAELVKSPALTGVCPRCERPNIDDDMCAICA